MFWENYVRLCNSINKAPNAVAAEVGIKGSGSVTGWKKGAIPRDGVLIKLADYFGVSPAELTGNPTVSIHKGGISEEVTVSNEAIEVAKAYDRADKRAKDIVKTALGPFGLSVLPDEAM